MTTSLPDYQEQQTHNEQTFREMAKILNPPLFALVEALDLTKINAYILYRVVHQLEAISNGSGWGSVEILVNDHRCVKVSGTDTIKMNDELVLGRNI